MQMQETLTETSAQRLETVKRFCIVVIFSIAFGYIEAAVVVYLRTIFYPGGFTFPLTDFGTDALWEQLLLTEIGRETASMALILTSSWLFGRSLRQRLSRSRGQTLRAGRYYLDPPTNRKDQAGQQIADRVSGKSLGPLSDIRRTGRRS